MKLLLIVAAWFAVAVIAREADAQEKPSKPVLCVSYQLARAESGVVGICHDNKKPFLMSNVAEVSAPGKEGGTVKVLVGWR